MFWTFGIQRNLFKFSRRLQFVRFMCQEDSPSTDLDNLIFKDREYNDVASRYLYATGHHRCLIIQPYVKWGPQKLEITPEEQLSEAVALIDTLPGWTVEETLTVPLRTLEYQKLFKSGSMERIEKFIQSKPHISAVFINSGKLKNITVRLLQETFRRPILDRYKIVMQIFKEHAKSKHAKLQVALAELYYVQRKAEKDLIFRSSNKETLKLMFQNREQHLKKQIEELRAQRHLLRQQRRKLAYPTVAVVGYTNAGKTALIKCLTGAEKLQPKNQLFATLDVTVHPGLFPSGLEVVYVDTVGFISDIPTDLIECFVATLEDALLADVILVAEDISTTTYKYKREHVFNTLRRLERETGMDNVLNKVICVGNKCDLIGEDHNKKDDILYVSAKTGAGLEELKIKLEALMLSVTGRKKVTVKVPNGGEEMRWLHKNATVLEKVGDENDSESLILKVIISQANLSKFKHYFFQ